MRIVEGITAKQEHVWIVIVSAVEDKEIEVGFCTRADAVCANAGGVCFTGSPV